MSEQSGTSRLVIWAGYFALSLLVLLPVSVLVVRSGAWQQGLMLYALCSAGAALLLLLFSLLLVLPAYRGQRAALVKSLLFTLPGSLLVLSIFSGGNYPSIHDISTDTQNPPEFVTALKTRGEGSNPLTVKPDSIAAQLEAYPDLATLRSDASAAQAYSHAIASAEALGWEVYHRDAEAGVIEAVDTTTIMGFKDDIVIRIQSAAEQTLIDLRSVSRVGRGDMGANAKRIRAFSQQFQQ
ncbi:MAG: DUF1499 domain-containing protein [Halioglobus sp.]